MSRIFDVSVPIRTGGLVYPGNPEIEISLQQAVAKGASANVSLIHFGSHTGTHADASRHFFDDGQPVDKIPLELLIGPRASQFRRQPDRSVSMSCARAPSGATNVLIRTRTGAPPAPGVCEGLHLLAPDGAQYSSTTEWSLSASITCRSNSSTRSPPDAQDTARRGRGDVEGLTSVPPPGEHEFIPSHPHRGLRRRAGARGSDKVKEIRHISISAACSAQRLGPRATPACYRAPVSTARIFSGDTRK